MKNDKIKICIRKDCGKELPHNRTKYCSTECMKIDYGTVTGFKQRTSQQNRALHLFCKLLAESLNNSGLDIRKVLKPEINIPWTTENVKNLIWHPIQKAMYGTDSTTQLPKLEQIDKIHEVIMREIGEKHGVEFIPFPVDEKRQFEKVSHGTYKP